MGIAADVGQPRKAHPKRPVTGFACARRDVSGKRLYTWARSRSSSASSFFADVFVYCYCPLAFMEASGRNRTPDKLPARDKRALLACCDLALAHTLAALRPRVAAGVGTFALERLHVATQLLRERVVGTDHARVPDIGYVTHPSPANPAANGDWGATAEAQLKELGWTPARLRDEPAGGAGDR